MDSVSGRDLMAASAGLYETTKLSFLRSRVSQVQSFAQKLLANGVGVLSPPGGHAVYLDMEDFFHGCDRDPEDFASIGFTLELIKDYGIRAIESGPFAWEWDKKTPEERAKIPNLVRFAVPRHVLSDEHINYAVAAIKELHKRRHTIPNVVITRGKETRLRHFQAGMKPVPVSRDINKSYVDEAARQLSHLSRVVELDQAAQDKLLHALHLGTGKWGKNLVPKTLDRSGWLSDVSNDRSPIEYSIALDQRTGESELRFLVEAQPKENSMAQLQESALRLNEDILAEYSEIVSMDRFHLLRDLFMPAQAEGTLAAWQSYAAQNGKEKWKMYLNPRASGIDNASTVTRQAFERVGLGGSWEVLTRIMTSPRDEILYVSLGLSPNLDDAEVKVYITHRDTTAAEIAQKHVSICPETSAYEIQRFLTCMAGGSPGPYLRKPLISCLAFKTKDPLRPVRTVHYAMDSYAASDADAQERIERYMSDISAPALYRERYRKAISAVQRRPLAEGRGIHSWVSLKNNPGGRLSNTFYLSAEFFGALNAGLTNGYH